MTHASLPLARAVPQAYARAAQEHEQKLQALAHAESESKRLSRDSSVPGHRRRTELNPSERLRLCLLDEAAESEDSFHALHHKAAALYDEDTRLKSCWTRACPVRLAELSADLEALGRQSLASSTLGYIHRFAAVCHQGSLATVRRRCGSSQLMWLSVLAMPELEGQSFRAYRGTREISRHWLSDRVEMLCSRLNPCVQVTGKKLGHSAGSRCQIRLMSSVLHVHACPH